MFTATPFTVAPKQNNPNVHQQTNCGISIKKCYRALKRNDGPCNVDDLENITLSERSQTQKVTLCLILLKRNIQNR